MKILPACPLYSESASLRNTQPPSRSRSPKIAYNYGVTSTKYFQPGDAVVYRVVWRGKLWWACAATVVEDSPELTALFWQAGTPVLRPSSRPTVQSILQNEVESTHAEWTRTDVLSLTQPGCAHAVDLMWEAGQRNLVCWYVNLQEPLRRTKVGFDTMDQQLDIVISPDKSHWQWKDEDEFAEAVEIGVFSKEEAAAIRTEGEHVIQLLENNQSPFRDGWENWTPLDGWGISSFPPSWDQIE
ncbi:MAG: DUF402 domain-containing protein [Anaerolineales bacterium]